MKLRRHGLAVGMARIGSKFFLSFKTAGKLTHKDYDTVVPLIDSALEGVKDPEVSVFIDGSELESRETRTAWNGCKRDSVLADAVCKKHKTIPERRIYNSYPAKNS